MKPLQVPQRRHGRAGVGGVEDGDPAVVVGGAGSTAGGDGVVGRK